MAYWNDVNGKTRSKEIYIGDGVDKIHSPLDILPQMATDMLNLTSKKYPSLTVRNGRSLLFDQTRLSYLATERFIVMSNPFMDSAGNIHYTFIKYNSDRSGVNLEGCDLLWYVKKPSEDIPVLKSARTFGFNTIPSTLDRESYATGNFSEYQEKVYFTYTHGGTGSHFMYGVYYTIETGIISSFATGGLTGAATRLVPNCVYLDKLFVGIDTELKYSATGLPTNFVLAEDSGSIPLSQGGMITSLTPMRDRLLISTSKAMFVLFGTGFDSFSISLLADNIGISGPKCVSSKNGIVYFAASDGDIYEYNGSSLLNITREPIDTGSRSGVKGGFTQSEFIITSMAVCDNYLYCVDDRTAYKKMYLFDLVKRRWYIQDYPYSETTLTNYYNNLFEGDNEIYSLITKISTVTGMEQIVNTLYNLDNGSANNISKVIDVAGTKQKETNTVIGTVSKAGHVLVTITHPYYETPDESYIDVSLNDTATQVATKIKAEFDTFLYFNNYFTLTRNNAALAFECKEALANESTFNINIKNDTCEGLTETNSANTTAGVANTYKTVTTQNLSSFKWISGAYQLSATGKQVLKAIHFTFYSPLNTDIGIYVSKSADADDFEKIVTLPIAASKQNQKFVLPAAKIGMCNWLRIKLEGHGNIEVYNMTMEWRVIDKIR